MKRIHLLTLTVFTLTLFSCTAPTTRLMIGSFTKPGEKGMSFYEFNTQNGELKLMSQHDVGMNPSYYCYSAKNKLLYVANEVMEFNGEFGGGLTTFRIQNGELEKQKEMRIPYGGPCFISMSPDSGFLFMANYPNGSVAVIKLDNMGVPQEITDTILFNKADPPKSHAHMILNDPSGRKIYMSDLGLDRMLIFDFDKNAGKLIATDTVNVEKGSGPRHFVFNSDGSRLYLINELGSKMMVFKITDNSRPELMQTLRTVTEGFSMDNFCADVHLSKDGKYLYGSNRGENSIVTFAVQPDGTLKLAGHTTCGGNWPRNFTLDPSGKFLLVGNQKSDSIAVFSISKTNGLPVEPGKRYKVPAPACLKFY
ncbi:MAG TPA: lactonase family protein [Bacteroidales bacterium]|nr:lactonase family protein [Bacteroidales bacterium]